MRASRFAAVLCVLVAIVSLVSIGPLADLAQGTAAVYAPSTAIVNAPSTAIVSAPSTATVHAPSTANSAPTAYVLANATIHTMTDAGTFVGSVVVEDGKVTAVGKDVTAPEGATKIDLTGYTLVPGLIDSHSVTWLTNTARDESSSRGALNILDGVNPWSEDWREVARQGITSVSIQPNNRGALGGKGAVLRVAPADSVQDLVVKSSVAVQASLGIAGDSPRERAAQIQRLKRALQAVKDGEDPPTLEAGNNNQQQQTPQNVGRGRRGRGAEPDPPIQQRGRGRRGGGFGARGAAATQPDQTKKLLQEILDRKIPLRLEVHQEDVVTAALDLAKEFEIDVILEGVSAPGKALDGRRARIITGPALETGATPAYRNDKADNWLNKLTEATDHWALATFATDARGSRMLRVQAAAAVAAGVPQEKVLQAVTSEAAKILGVADKVGSIAPGLNADLAVFAGDPLDASVSARLVMSGGAIVYESEAQPRDSATVVVELPKEMPRSYVIRTKRMLNDSGEFRPAEMLVQNGRIVGLGSKVNVPEGTEVFDLGDAVVTPGLVVAHSYLGQTAMLTDDTEADASELHAADVVDAGSPAAKKMMGGGFVNVAVAPAGVNVSAGVVAGVRLGAKAPVTQRDAAGKFVLAASARNDQRYPGSLVGQIQMLDTMFAGQTPETRLYVPPAVAQAIMRDRRTNIEAVVTGGRRCMIAAESNAEVAAALQLIKAHKLHAALLGPTRFQGLIPEMAGAEVGIIARPADENDYDLAADQLAAASAASVPVAFSGESPEQIRITAALAVNAGMAPAAALRGLTFAGAQLAGLPAGTAQLAEGGVADFVVWTGSPLDLRANVACVVVQGEVEQQTAAKGRITDE